MSRTHSTSRRRTARRAAAVAAVTAAGALGTSTDLGFNLATFLTGCDAGS